ncbi:hypothetical protein [Psychroflexus aestuariivivens]|uniref:hypothetical protein n=1 Tax=Psychroflexus aestuariivivens TaxID=1795040 RepID=UPI001EFFA82C|nr:hypothetical protein [Psychroflexus aestuariivivens]
MKYSKLGLVLVSVFLMMACAQKVAFPVSNVVPGAEVEAKIKTDNNDNYEIDLKVKNLTSPDRLEPPKEMYVVWVETERGTKNLGRLEISKGMFSGTRSGSLKTVSPYKPKRILITAENSSSNNEPGSQVILSSEEISMK